MTFKVRANSATTEVERTQLTLQNSLVGFLLATSRKVSDFRGFPQWLGTPWFSGLRDLETIHLNALTPNSPREKVDPLVIFGCVRGRLPFLAWPQ